MSTIYYRTAILTVGPDVPELLEGGILILFADGAPPELAQVSVLHRVSEGPGADPPPVGASIAVGDVEATLTAIGSLAWNKIADMGHVVINFDGAAHSQRPGELSASAVPLGDLAAAINPGAAITISA